MDADQEREQLEIEPWHEESYFDQLAESGEVIRMEVANGDSFMARFVRRGDSGELPHYKLVAAPEACGLCHREPAEGFAMVGAIRYCHEDESPTCYERASLLLPYR